MKVVISFNLFFFIFDFLSDQKGIKNLTSGGCHSFLVILLIERSLLIMRLFKNTAIKVHQGIGQELIKQISDSCLHEPNGKVQSLWLTLFVSSGSNKNANFNERPTEELNEVLDTLQKQGYTIKDVKFNSAENQGWENNTTLLHVLILIQ